MPNNTSDRIGAVDEAYVDFEVWGDDGVRIGRSGLLYLTRKDRPEFVSVRFPDEGTIALIPFGMAEIDEELSMIRLDAPAHVALNAPRMPEGVDPEEEYVRNAMRHFNLAETFEALGPSDTTPTDPTAADPTTGDPGDVDPANVEPVPPT